MGNTVEIGAWLCVLLVCVNGNHPWGSPVLSLDPLRAALSALSSSRSSSRASSSAGGTGASSSSWSSAGSGIRHAPRISVLSTRRRGGQRGASPRNIVMLTPQRGHVNQGSALMGILGALRNRQTVSRRHTPILRHHMTGTRGYIPSPIRVIAPQRPVLRSPGPIFSSIPIGTPIGSVSQTPSRGGMLYVDGTNLGSLSNVGQVIPGGPQGTFAIDPTAIGAQIPINGPGNKLTIKGQTASGDLIINGPSGSITIGADVLNGISQQRRGGFLNTEFEEIEPGEEAPMMNNSSGGLKLTSTSGHSLVLTGKETLLPQHSLNRVPSSAVGGAVGGANAIVLGGLSSSSSASSAASSSASANAGGVIASSSSSASSSALSINNGASAGAASGTGGVGGGAKNDGSIIVKSGTAGNERVVRLGQADGKPKTITLGGASGIQVGQSGNGIQVPGNATVIIGG